MSPRRPVSAGASLVLPALLSLAGALAAELAATEASAQTVPSGARPAARRHRGQRVRPVRPNPPVRPTVPVLHPPTGGAPMRVQPLPVQPPTVQPPPVQPPAVRPTPRPEPPLAVPGGLGRVTTAPRHLG